MRIKLGLVVFFLGNPRFLVQVLYSLESSSSAHSEPINSKFITVATNLMFGSPNQQHPCLVRGENRGGIHRKLSMEGSRVIHNSSARKETKKSRHKDNEGRVTAKLCGLL